MPKMPKSVQFSLEPGANRLSDESLFIHNRLMLMPFNRVRILDIYTRYYSPRQKLPDGRFYLDAFALGKRIRPLTARDQTALLLQRLHEFQR
jgi:hypothetical protein